MKQVVLMIIVLGAIAAVAITNPSREKHEEAIIDQYKKQNPISGALGVGNTIAKFVEYHNYVVYSTTTIDDERISVGYLTRVEVRSMDINDILMTLRSHLPPEIIEILEKTSGN